MAQCRVRWTKRASRRLDEIGAYIALDDPDTAERVILRIVTAVDALAIHPLDAQVELLERAKWFWGMSLTSSPIA